MKEKYCYLVIGIFIGCVVGYGVITSGVFHNAEIDIEMDGAEMQDMDMPQMNQSGTHDHKMTEVDVTLPIPGISIEAFEDTMDGYNIKISTNNFTFAPEEVNTDPVANKGHAHIYVNDTKISRLYGSWFHLSAKHLTEDINIVEVTINTNDHSEWAVDGAHIRSTLKIEKN